MNDPILKQGNNAASTRRDGQPADGMQGGPHALSDTVQRSDTMISNNTEQQKSPASSTTAYAPKRGLAYIATAGLILLNVGLFGASLLIALLSLMIFDSPDASISSISFAARVSYFLLFTMPIPLGAATFVSIRLHGKERFWAIVALTGFSMIYFVIPYSLMIFW